MQTTIEVVRKTQAKFSFKEIWFCTTFVTTHMHSGTKSFSLDFGKRKTHDFTFEKFVWVVFVQSSDVDLGVTLQVLLLQ